MHLSLHTAAFLTLTASLAIVSAAPAAVIVNDQFTDGGLTNGTDPLDAAWTKINGDNAVISVANNELVFDNGRSNDTGAFPAAKGSYLLSGETFEVGETLTLSLDFRVTISTPLATSGSSNASNGAAFRFGIGSSSDAFAATFGSGNVPGGTLQRYGVDSLSGNSTNLTTAGGDTVAIDDNAEHTFTLAVSRTTANTLVFDASIGSASWSGTRTGVSNFNFDRILVGQGSVNNLDMALDNFEVSIAVVPEPTSLGLFGLGSLICLRRRR